LIVTGGPAHKLPYIVHPLGNPKRQKQQKQHSKQRAQQADRYRAGEVLDARPNPQPGQWLWTPYRKAQKRLQAENQRGKRAIEEPA
jgi:hypothetical protein